MTDPLSDAETLKMDDDSRLTEIGRRPSSYTEIQAQYMGLIKLSQHGSKAVMEQWDSFTEHTLFMGRTAAMMYMTDLLEALIGAGASIEAVPVEHGWLEIDTVTDLERYEEMLEAGTLSQLFNLPSSAL